MTIIKAEEYDAYFKGKLKEHGYESPADIPDDKKDDFFNDVDEGYNSKDEAGEDGVKATMAELALGQTTTVAAKKKANKHRERLDKLKKYLEASDPSDHFEYIRGIASTLRHLGLKNAAILKYLKDEKVKTDYLEDLYKRYGKDL